MKAFKIIDREGPEDYATTLALQQNLLEAKAADRDLLDSLILVEHEPVYTYGRGTPESERLLSPPEDVPPARWVEITRGGKATFHGPGQLVAYPIFDLTRHGKDVHRFLRMLEEVIIQTLAEFDIIGTRREGLTGVWVETSDGWKKIASIGIGVRRWISYHGLALNVQPDLRYFQAITPCGQPGAVMTSMAELRLAADRVPPALAEVKQTVATKFEQIFGLTLDREASLLAGERPSWLKVRVRQSDSFDETKNIVKSKGLVTVCEEARCPNMGECWSHRTATFMVMGELCTRRCAFCSVKDGLKSNLQPLDIFEPFKVAQAVEELGLKHVVVTSVNRDDLPDMGADHFQRVARGIKERQPECTVEFLIPDMRGRRELVERILDGGYVSILNHNVETVPRLYRTVRPGAKLERSLQILRWAKEINPDVRTKSGLMVGLGERRDEVLELLDLLAAAGVDIVTIGQYLQPSQKQLPVRRFVTPEEFADYEREGKLRGFRFVESGPFVRSSYHAWKHAPREAETRHGENQNPAEPVQIQGTPSTVSL
ncbi:MAG: lipoyl synthase [Bdellovibrionales bacterium]|nr:lipoyl synthase [Bdellovibrionales bacterium]